MQIGDRVRISVGPKQGAEFVIKYRDEFTGEVYFSSPDTCWYPESSLELVSKPKTFRPGERVRAIGLSLGGYDHIGQVGKIIQVIDEPNGLKSYDAGMAIYAPEALELVEVIGPSRWKETHNIGAKFTISE